LDRIDLCDLPIDILKSIVSWEITLLEKHILRFVCKKKHDIVHHIFYSSARSATRSASIKFLDSEKLDEIAAIYGNLNIFKWVVSNFDKGNLFNVSYNAARYGGNIDLMEYAKSVGYPNSFVCDGAASGGHLEALCVVLARNTKMGQKK
jgi:hypothetical protein